MADRQYHDDIPMDDYYENGMLREDPDDIPAAKKKHNVPSGRSKRQAAMGKIKERGRSLFQIIQKNFSIKFA